jgi:hypothetical protein
MPLPSDSPTACVFVLSAVRPVSSVRGGEELWDPFLPAL